MTFILHLMTVRWPLWLRLLLATGFAAGGLAARLICQVDAGAVPFVTYYPAVALASLLPGLASGLLALLLSIAFAWRFTAAPFGLMLPEHWGEIAELVVFAMMGLAFVFGGLAIKSAVATLARQRDDATARAGLRQVVLQALRHCVSRYLEYASATLHELRSRAAEPAMIAALDAGIARLESLGRLYRRLYAPEEMAGGPVGLFVEDICRDLLSTAGHSRLSCHVRVGSLSLPSEHKVALGLIVAELVTGALEGAPERSGNLEIGIAATGEQQCEVSFRDTQPEAERSRAAAAPGDRLALTKLLVHHLQGSVSEEIEAERVVRVRFPI